MRRPLVALLLVVALAVVPASAAAARAGGTVVVGPDERVNGLTATGGTVVVQGTVDGDLTAFAGTVVIAENGTVTGQVRVYAGNVRIGGTVGTNVVAYAGSVTVTDGALVKGTLAAGSGQVVLAGTVRGDATLSGNVTLAPSAQVGGDLIYDGTLHDRGGRVDGEIRQASDLALLPDVPGLLLSAYLLLADALLGALLLVAFPRFSFGAANTAHAEPGRSAVAGILAIVAVPLACVLLAVTVVGIPLALIGLVAFLTMLWVGTVLGRFAVGSWLLSYVDEDRPWAALALGLVVVALLAQVPYLGPLVRAVVALLGVGVLALGVRAVYVAVRERRGGLTSL